MDLFQAGHTVRAGLVSLIILAAAHTARAQDAEPERGESTASLQQSLDGVDEEARSLFEAGRTAFSHGRFEDALDHFQRAHTLSGRPELLYNVAISLDRLRRDREAIDAFRGYLDQVPDAGNRAEIEGRIEQLERHAYWWRTHGDARGSAPDEGHGATTGSETSTTSSSILPILGWTAGGLAAASLIATIGFWVGSEGAYGDLEQMCLPAGCSADFVHASSVSTLDTMTNVFLVSTIVFAVAAGTLFTLHLTTRDDVEVALGPGGVLVRGAL